MPTVVLSQCELDLVVFRHFVDFGYLHSAHAFFHEGRIKAANDLTFNSKIVERANLIPFKSHTSPKRGFFLTSDASRNFFNVDSAQWTESGTARVALSPLMGPNDSSTPSSAKYHTALQFLDFSRRTGVPHAFLVDLLKRALIYSWMLDHLVPSPETPFKDTTKYDPTTTQDIDAFRYYHPCCDPYGFLIPHDCSALKARAKAQADRMNKSSPRTTRRSSTPKTCEELDQLGAFDGIAVADDRLPNINMPREHIDIMVLQYLNDTGREHSAFTFSHESHLEDKAKEMAMDALKRDDNRDVPISFNASEALIWVLNNLPDGCLVEALTKGIFHLHVEFHTDRNGKEISCDSPFGIFKHHICATSQD